MEDPKTSLDEEVDKECLFTDCCEHCRPEYVYDRLACPQYVRLVRLYRKNDELMKHAKDNVYWK